MKEPREFVIVEMPGLGASMRNYRIKHENESMGSIEAGCRNGPIENYYKVIEKSAFETLQKENEELKHEIIELKEDLGFRSSKAKKHEKSMRYFVEKVRSYRKENEALKEKLAKAKEALNYIRDIELIQGDVLFYRFDQPLLESTLAELGE